MIMDLPNSTRTPSERAEILLAGIAHKMPGEKVDFLVHKVAIVKAKTDLWVRQNFLTPADWLDDESAAGKLALWLGRNL
jgi:hypothetical protein